MALDIDCVRCEALFASQVQASQHPTVDQIRDAIRRTVRALGSRGCVDRVAAEFGDHPETAVRRMRWAREQVAALTSNPSVDAARGGDHRGNGGPQLMSAVAF